MGDNKCSNGIQHQGSAMTDAQLFEEQFEELVSELTEKDFTDPVLADALNRLRDVLQYNAPGARGTGACLSLAHCGSLCPPQSCHMTLSGMPSWLAGALSCFRHSSW
ncbi:hypothetical protein ANANG_G00007740 [Anguilla anguilla]|uniref:Uncharacterized protein n=1 Tax=Anguilla anguilla TaxID=7936 RepID=A0A9D3MZ85_ANGAN|nr:hypothetical protein ANANG_G00007740 [Anguilla anguilla]